jgi:hypothetical protein
MMGCEFLFSQLKAKIFILLRKEKQQITMSSSSSHSTARQIFQICVTLNERKSCFFYEKRSNLPFYQ